MSRLTCVILLLAIGLVGQALAMEGDATTSINFNFEGMIPPSTGGCGCTPKHHRLTYYEKSTTDVADPGFGSAQSAPLQRDVWANLLWNEEQTEVIGHDIGHCVVTPVVNNSGPLYQLCHVIHYLGEAEDQLVIVGATTFQSVPQTVNVVGGSGKYLGAHGSCTYQPFDNYDVHYVCDIITPCQ